MKPANTITHEHWRDFLNTSLDERISRLHRQSAQHTMLTLFRDAAATVPAYGQFLARHNVDVNTVQSIEEFQHLPLVTKDNYMRAYPLAQRCRDGRVQDCEMIAVSSGSTGQPMFWPRSLNHELDIATRFEQIFRHAFRAHERSTLAVVCFAMGTWVGGIFTAQCCRYLSQKGYPLTLVTPGSNPAEILRAVTELGPMFDQVVLLGYPPFVKGVIDNGTAQGIDWPALKPKLVFAGEVFSEEWRDILCRRIGSTSPCLDTASLYGTADAGVLGNETPLSIAIRRMLSRRPDAARELFGESRLPTLVQFDPLSRYFEVVDDTLVVSGDNGVPLVRYHIADKGGVIEFNDMMEFVNRRLGDPHNEADANAPWITHDLPFVYIFGRADFTVSYFGANIYPENISVGLEQTKVRDYVSGKFVLDVLENNDGNKCLSIAVELLPNINASDELNQNIATSIRQQLRRLNSEFAHYVPEQYQTPVITLHPNGDPSYFPAGVKHRYTRRP